MARADQLTVAPVLWTFSRVLRCGLTSFEALQALHAKVDLTAVD